MSNLLRQSTAATRTVGPVFNLTTGAVDTTLAIGDFSISKNGTMAAMAAAATATSAGNGMYAIAMTTGNTDTINDLVISCNKAGYQMAPRAFTVLSATMFDFLMGTTAPSTLTQTQISGGAYDLTNATFVAALKTALGKVPATLAPADVSGNLPADVKAWNGGALPTGFAANNLPNDYQQRGVAVTLPIGTGDGRIELTDGKVTTSNPATSPSEIKVTQGGQVTIR